MRHTKHERKKFPSHFTCHDLENDVFQKFSQEGCDNKELNAELSNLMLKLRMQAFSFFSEVCSNFLMHIQSTTPLMAKELFLLNDTGKNKSQSWTKA